MKWGPHQIVMKWFPHYIMVTVETMNHSRFLCSVVSSLLYLYLIFSITSLTLWGRALPLSQKCQASLPWRRQVATLARSAYLASPDIWCTTTLELHTATYPKISYIPVCWYHSNLYCFPIYHPMKMKLTSVVGWNRKNWTDLTRPNLHTLT